MTNQGVNFHLPPGGQISAAVDTVELPDPCRTGPGDALAADLRC
jgi:hypothetical protein